MLFSFNEIDKFKISNDKKNLSELIQNLFEFYRVGHATKQQIYKSVAIQIYEFYKNDFAENELNEIISILITSYFDLDENYNNFNKIGEQEIYVKNVVYNFPIFECNTKLLKEQKTLIIRMFSSKNGLFPKVIPLNLRKKILDMFFNNIHDYYYKQDSLRHFGFIPKKV